MIRDLTRAIEHLPHGPLHYAGEVGLDLVKLGLAELAAFARPPAHRRVCLAVDSGFQRDEICSVEPLSVELAAFRIDLAFMENARGFGFHAHVESGALGLALPDFCHGNRLQLLVSLLYLFRRVALALKR